MKLISLLLFFVLIGPCLVQTGIPNYCKLPLSMGQCKDKPQEAEIQSFYNSTAGFCEAFTYGGCQGNRNNFVTLERCENGCKGSSAYDWCRLAPETGPCKAKIINYFYNPKLGQCQTFTYGGCNGNRNNFENKSSCLKACKYQKTKAKMQMREQPLNSKKQRSESQP